jgi:hypothetical protein
MLLLHTQMVIWVAVNFPKFPAAARQQISNASVEHDDEANGILCHSQGFLLILAISYDFGQRRHTYREATLFLWFKHDRKPVRLSGHVFHLVA